MTKIKNLRMWQTICNDARISISKSLFGLNTTATYNKTNSVIAANIFEYPPADGEKLKTILESPREKLNNAIGDFHPKKTVNGNYMAEVCVSQDGDFVAVQLNQFIHMSYEPVSEVLIFEGTEAQSVKRLF